MSKIVAIIGRPNVGKSTFFNRLVGSRQAVVDDISGITRDRHYGTSYWNGIHFSVIDTGGYAKNSGDEFEEEIQIQIQLAIEESDVILFLIDVQAGISSQDLEIAGFLRKSKKPLFLVANKVDSDKYTPYIGEFYELGLGEIYPISSANGSGTGELLDALVKNFPKENDSLEESQEEIPKIAIVGRPNAGKSTLINMLLEEKRNIVTDIPGTTRDSIYIPYKKFGFDCVLVDTAGMRKKAKTHEDLEFYCVVRAIRAIEASQVCLLLIDATRGLEAQDMSILHLITKNNKGVVIVVNKWDLVKKETNSAKEFENTIKKKLAPFNDIPILFISALEKTRIFKAMEIAMKVNENRKKKIKTSLLNEVMLPIIEKTPPPSLRSRYVKVKYCVQLPTYTPQFAFFANHPKDVKEPYRRFIENKLREHFDFKGVPIHIYFRNK